eukprot:2630460-Amphidinium_carterae.1
MGSVYNESTYLFASLRFLEATVQPRMPQTTHQSVNLYKYDNIVHLTTTCVCVAQVPQRQKSMQGGSRRTLPDSRH